MVLRDYFLVDVKDSVFNLSLMDLKSDPNLTFQNENLINMGETQERVNTFLINNSQNNLNSTANISIEQAKEIALNHANLTSNQVIFSRTELDYDNGIQKYEVEFYYNNREYSYEIDANTRNILSYEED